MVTRMVFSLPSGKNIFNEVSLRSQARNSRNKEERKKKTRQGKEKDKVKNELVRSLVESGFFENEQLAQRADNVWSV